MATFVAAVMVAVGALAAGSYALVRHDQTASSSEHLLRLASVRLKLAAEELPHSPTPEDLSGLLGLYRAQSADPRLQNFEALVVARSGQRSTDARLRLDAVPPSLRRAVAASEVPVHERAMMAGDPVLVAAGRVPDAETEVYFFFSERALWDSLHRLELILLGGWGSIVLLTALISGIIARKALRPVRRAAAAAHSMAEGLLDTRLPVATNDEFGIWAAAFNRMAEALNRRVTDLVESQARERRFTADVAHELKTPLTSMVTGAEFLQDQLPRLAPDVRRATELVVADVNRMQRLVSDLLEISRMESGSEQAEHEPVDVKGLIHTTIRTRGWEDRVSLDLDDVWLETDPRRLERVVANLVENAVRHGRTGVRVRLASEGSSAVIEVSDRGAGISPQDLDHVFERFYKANGARASGGSGLGLAIVAGHVKLLGGSVVVGSRPDLGTRFTLTLPTAPRGDAARADTSRDPAQLLPDG
jgi:signal transduction histidine kinase